jgi:hypothetical protein
MLPEVFRGLPNDLGLRYLWPLLSQLVVTQHWAQNAAPEWQAMSSRGAAGNQWRPVHSRGVFEESPQHRK